MTRMVIPIYQPKEWPSPLLTLLSCLRGSKASDETISALTDAILGYSITGWHCTRLTGVEIGEILDSGMKLPDGRSLRSRIDTLVRSGQIARDIGHRLATENQANERNRAGRLWFCFYPLHLAGEEGIGRFFRYWGGEALYRCHEHDPVTSPILREIGTPCVVEADVPIGSLTFRRTLAERLLHIYRIQCDGMDYTSESEGHEDSSERAIEARCVRRVIRYSDPDFARLTGCETWRCPP